MTAGATEALSGALLALLDTGDEVVLFEPMYDCYAAGIAMAGGVARPVPLRPPADGAGPWTFDPAELRAAITPRARMLLLNTPHNPTGKVFTAEELRRPRRAGHRARPARAHRRGLRAPGLRRGASTARSPRCPGMRERTLVVSSAGKTFNVTGWKVGWICGPAPLVSAVRTAKQFLTYVNGGPFQPADRRRAGAARRATSPHSPATSSTAATCW